MYKFNDRILLLFICSLPLCLIIGPFCSDLTITIGSLIFLIGLTKHKIKFYFLNKYSLFFFIWFFYLLFSSLISDNVFLSLESTLFYFRFWIYSLALCYLLINYKITVYYLFFFLSVALLIVLIDAYCQLFFGNIILGYNYDFNHNQSRLSGIFGEENILGSYLSRILPLFFILFIQLNFKKYLNFYFITSFFLINFILILFSGERTSIFYFFIFILFFIFDLKYFFKKMNQLWIFLISFIVLLILLLYNSENLKNRILEYTFYQFSEGSTINIFSIQHQVIYKTGIKIFLDNKYVGIGPKLFREKCKNYKTYSKYDNSIDGCQTHPHNSYLQILLETGIFGFLFIIIIFIYMCIQLFKFVFLINFSPDNFSFKYTLVMIFITLFPLVPTGNFFSNWISAIYYLPIGIFLYYKLEKDF